MKKIQNKVQVIRRKMVLEVPVELSAREVPSLRRTVLVTAKAIMGVFNTSTSSQILVGTRAEDRNEITEKTVGKALAMIKDMLGRSEKELGIDIRDRSRPMRRRVLDYIEPSNKDRAEWTREVMEIYRSLHYGPREDMLTVISDFLCNLHHHVDRLRDSVPQHLRWDSILQRADLHYTAEIVESKMYVAPEPKKGKKPNGNQKHRR